jgi:hypothetical protein
MQLGRFRLGFFRRGNCWSIFKCYRNVYSSGELTYLGWWRFYLAVDRRFA